mmetsp:Transcript_6057/g.11513  ORF Transcript_6057/g.11513 Transcript_6057/m.11513 type:complete len:208 (+) Transcript_6057:115-738(+)
MGSQSHQDKIRGWLHGDVDWRRPALCWNWRGHTSVPPLPGGDVTFDRAFLQGNFASLPCAADGIGHKDCSSLYFCRLLHHFCPGREEHGAGACRRRHECRLRCGFLGGHDRCLRLHSQPYLHCRHDCSKHWYHRSRQLPLRGVCRVFIGILSHSHRGARRGGFPIQPHRKFLHTIHRVICPSLPSQYLLVGRWRAPGDPPRGICGQV